MGRAETPPSQEEAVADTRTLAGTYGLDPWVVEDLAARKRAGARDQELINLLRETDRGGLAEDRAAELVKELDLSRS